VNALVAAVALPVTVLVLAALLRLDLGGRLGGRLVAAPSGERWHERPTPIFGGVGIFLGLAAGIGATIAVGAVDASAELLGILGGCAILFVAGLLDDLVTLKPVAKLAAQFGAAAVVLASGLSVEVIESEPVAVVVGLLWLVGITNAFNLLDNMDGLAASLAAIACGYYALAAATENPSRLVLVLALALGFACVGFLPFNLRRGRTAAVFMGDSGSQVLGFALASLALASSWTVAGTTLATILLPLLVLAVPILDTALVTVRRVLEGRPVAQGGKDHASHRLVYYGLSERQAVAVLAIVAAALGATAVAYNILNNPRVTILGVLVTFVLLVQFASALSDLEEQSRRTGTLPAHVSLRALFVQPRRLVEIVVDFGAICVSFLVAYLVQVGGYGTDYQRAVFLAALPILLATRYLFFVAFAVYRRVWRFAGLRDAAALAAATFLSAPVALFLLTLTWDLNDFPAGVFLVDALLCLVLVGSARLALRVLPELAGRRGEAQRVVVVGAGRAGRSLAREVGEQPGRRVVGFVDDNPELRRRRIRGVTVHGSFDELPRLLGQTRVDEVLVSVPNAPEERLAVVLAACREAGVSCSFVRREITPTPSSPVRAAAE
jgi:UDP-GlcNAc:undecaprenyl-phosphate/decaprenyl-phosphate GlcNAc-1-phosphate transferase